MRIELNTRTHSIVEHGTKKETELLQENPVNELIISEELNMFCFGIACLVDRLGGDYKKKERLVNKLTSFVMNYIKAIENGKEKKNDGKN